MDICLSVLYRVSSSCTHVSAILHALVSLNPSSLTSTSPYNECDDPCQEDLPVTSKLCKWNVPKGRKDCSLTMMGLTFSKHDYSKPNKRSIKVLEDFDPRSQEFRGTACQHLPVLLDKLRGKQLSISLLLDPSCWSAEKETAPECQAADATTLKETCVAFKRSLHLSEQQIRDVELRLKLNLFLVYCASISNNSLPLWYCLSSKRHHPTRQTSSATDTKEVIFNSGHSIRHSDGTKSH